ncbi:MAG: AraC family transcriptional regulator [Eubacteriales bacterium]|nr:AraC family transcriptional regulator [Eubacteriales bacterium]
MKWNKLSIFTLRSFFTYLLCLTLPVLLLGFSLIIRNMNQDLQTKTAEMRCERIADLMAERLDSISYSATGLYEMNWFLHFNTSNTLFDSEFNIPTRCEIYRQLQNLSEGMQLSEDVIAVVPVRNTVISSLGWYKINEYAPFTGYADIGIDTATGRPIVTPRETFDGIVLTYYSSSRAHSPCAVCVMLSREKIGAYIESIEADLPAYISISYNNQLLYQRGDAGSLKQYTAAAGLMMPIHVTVGYNPQGDAAFFGFLTHYTRDLILILAVLLVLAAALTIVKHRPLNRLITQNLDTLPSGRGSVYKQLDEMVKDVKKENSALREENRSIGQSILRMRTYLQNELIYSMLSSPSFDYDDPLVIDNLPWIRDGLPFLLVVIESEDETIAQNSSRIDELLGESLHRASYRLTSTEQVTLLWYARAEEAKRLAARLAEQIPAAEDEGFYAVSSPLLSDMTDLRESYVMLKKQLQVYKRDKSRLPIMIQLDLITKLQSGKPDECIDLLRSVRGKHKPRAFLELFVRLAHEYSLTVPEIGDAGLSDDALWDTAFALVRDLSRQFEALRRSDSLESSAMIKEYIDAHFREPEMSIKQLSDVFGLSGTMISKLFKASYNVTFSDYLLELRMKAALALLQDSHQNLTEISESVGYLNYYSFKRAFIRHQGVSPKEFREKTQGTQQNIDL